MKKFITLLLMASTLITVQMTFAEDDSWATTSHYQQGSIFLKNFQYSSAISEYKKALQIDSEDFPSRTGLINAYLARATYYNNQTKEFTKAANDLRSALFYLKYYGDDLLQAVSTSAIPSTEQNLSTVLSSLNFDTSPRSRLKAAKMLRSQGEFAASATECYYALSDYNLRKEIYPMLGGLYNILGNKFLSVENYEKAVELQPKNADIILKLAKAYDDIDEIDKAAEKYNLVLELKGDNPDILYELEKIWLKKIDKDPNNAEAVANLGAIYQKKGNLDEALRYYQRSQQLNPANTTTKKNLGILYQQTKNYAKAIECYNSILTHSPTDVNIRCLKAECLKALENYEDAIKEYKMALSYDTGNKKIKYELFDLLKTSGSNDEVLKMLYDNVQENNQNPDTYYQFAYELHKANKLQDSIVFYDDAIRLNPKMKDAYINKAQALKQMNNYEKSIETINAGLQNLPNDKDLLTFRQNLINSKQNEAYNAATKVFESGDYVKAAEMYAAISPATANSLSGAAVAYQKLGDIEKTIAYYKKAFNLSPKNAEIAYCLAVLAYENANTNDAIFYLKKTIENNPNNANAKKLLASLEEDKSNEIIEEAAKLYDAKKYPEALSQLNSIIAKYPTNANGYYYRGLVYDAQKKYNLAITDYLKAISLNKELNIINYSLGVDYDYIGQYKSALNYFKKYLANEKVANEFTQYAQSRVQALKVYDK